MTSEIPDRYAGGPASRRESRPRALGWGIGRGAGVLVAAAFVAVAAWGVLRLTAGPAAAPSARSLPLIAGARVVVDYASEDLENPNHPRNFRYMAIEVPRSLSAKSFFVSEVRYLLRRGWSGLDSLTFVGNSSTPRTVPVGTPGADALINAPAESAYAALSYITTRGELGDAADLNSSGYSTVQRLVSRHDPVLVIQMGDGTHG